VVTSAWPGWLTAVSRPFPSCVLVVIAGPRPIVVDPGSLTDADQLPELLAGAGVALDDVATVACSHYHSDHVGAVGVLQAAGAKVAAHAWDAAMVNARDPQACASRWLNQPVLPYGVDRPLSEGDVLSTGSVDLHVLHTPGHTLGGVSLWEPDSRTLICGDALHAKDTPWIGSLHEGAGALQRAQLTLDRIEQLDPALVISGHGPPIDDTTAAIEQNRERIARWAADPPDCVMYAGKRILTYRLMLEPIPSDQVDAVLGTAPWLRDLASSIDRSADQLLDDLLKALASSLTRGDGLLGTTAAHRASPVAIRWELTDIPRWPAHRNCQAETAQLAREGK
jgi:hydroxyacylglutathione hydrolase